MKLTNRQKIKFNKIPKTNKKAIKNSDKVYGENNLDKFLEAQLEKIEKNLKTNNLTIKELDDKIQADYRNIKDNRYNKDNLVSRINDSIGKMGAKKRIKELKIRIKNLVNADQKEIKDLKEKILKTINSKNEHDQNYGQEAKKLLNKLENFKQNNLFSEKNYSMEILFIFIFLINIFLPKNNMKIRKIKRVS